MTSLQTSIDTPGFGHAWPQPLFARVELPSLPGWRVRLKRPAAQAAGAVAGPSVEQALSRAVLAYRAASQSAGEPPCRAALQAYLALRPQDGDAADRVVSALVALRRQHPAWFA